ncbi:MAG: Tad domain-containing protein [Proteobacteria bacterium]|nr:Tad domain-containing protein [Pseudomonadota bacterium]
MAVAVALLGLILLVTAFGLLRFGRLRLERQQLQQAADSLALAAGIVLRDEGREAAGQHALSALAARLALAITGRQDVQLLPIELQLEHDAAGREIGEVLTVRLSASAEPLMAGRAAIQLQAAAAVRLGRELQPAGSEGWPAVVYVVEATNSLWQKIEGTEQSFWEIVYQAFNQTKLEQLPAATGLVAFARQEQLPAVEPRLHNSPAIRAGLQQLNRIADVRRGSPFSFAFIRAYFDSSTRNIDLGLKRAAALLAAPQHARRSRNVVLVATGPPLTDERAYLQQLMQFWRSPSDETMESARALRGPAARPGAALYSVELGTWRYPTEVLDEWAWGMVARLQGKTMARFLVDAAGAAGSEGGDPAYYYPLNLVDTADRLGDRLTSGACSFRVGADRGAAAAEQDSAAISRAARAGRLGVFVVGESEGSERRLPRLLDGTTNALAQEQTQGYALQNLRGWPELRLALGTCLALGRDPHQRLLVRWGEPAPRLPALAAN